MSALMEIELANAARLDKFDARIAALELRSDVLQAVLSLCEMAVNPAAIKARVLELRRQADQARDLQAKACGRTCGVRSRQGRVRRQSRGLRQGEGEA